MTSILRRATIVAAALAGSAAFATSALAGPVLPVYDGPPSAKYMQARPNVIVYTGDGSGFFAGHGVAGRRQAHPPHLHWTSWTALQARGWGADWIDNCTPNCAHGRFTPYNVNLHAYRPRHLGGWLVFTRLAVTFTSHRPSFQHAVTTLLRITYIAGGGGFSY